MAEAELDKKYETKYFKLCAMGPNKRVVLCPEAQVICLRRMRKHRYIDRPQSQDLIFYTIFLWKDLGLDIKGLDGEFFCDMHKESL